jgi:hypothetical protein
MTGGASEASNRVELTAVLLVSKPPKYQSSSLTKLSFVARLRHVNRRAIKELPRTQVR